MKPLAASRILSSPFNAFPLSLRTGRRRLVKISPWSPAFPPEPPLRVRIPRIVRLLLRYYADVRLLNDVRVRIAATAFPYRPAYRATAGVVELSRFSSIECPRMHRVSDSAGPAATGCITPLFVVPSRQLYTVGAPDFQISELNGWPTYPLSTLHVRSHDRPRMTRGHDGSAHPFM